LRRAPNSRIVASLDTEVGEPNRLLVKYRVGVETSSMH